MQRREPIEPSGRRPVKRLSPAAAARKSPNSVNAIDAQTDVAVLVHELGNLLDGSMRWVGLALKTLDQTRADRHDELLDRVHQQLEAAAGAMEKMADLVSAAMRGASTSVGTMIAKSSAPTITLYDAVRHALDVCRPSADELGVVVKVELPEEFREISAGPLYSAVLNALTNALESIEECHRAVGRPSTGPGGQVEIVVREEGASGPRVDGGWIAINITDDGLGPPPGAGQRIFDHGFTTKNRGSGFGLSVSQGAVQELGGTIALLPRADRRDPARPGATLRLAFPRNR